MLRYRLPFTIVSAAIVVSGSFVLIPQSHAATKSIVSISIVVNNGAGAQSKWTLRCQPVAGTHPNRKKACTQLLKAGIKSMAPTPSDTMCTEIYGGPETATVSGSWSKKKIRATFSRINGCEISRWEKISLLLR